MEPVMCMLFRSTTLDRTLSGRATERVDEGGLGGRPPPKREVILNEYRGARLGSHCEHDGIGLYSPRSGRRGSTPCGRSVYSLMNCPDADAALLRHSGPDPS